MNDPLRNPFLNPRLTEIRVHEARTGKPPSRSLTLKFQEGVIR